MRNGTGRSDRGNAILSDLPLTDAWGVELPLVLQRRVPLAASLHVPDGPLHLVSAHLDPRGPPGAAWLGGAGRAAQTAHLLDRVAGDLVVLGADLNLGRGRREPSWRLLGDADFATGVPPAPLRLAPHLSRPAAAGPRLPARARSVRPHRPRPGRAAGRAPGRPRGRRIRLGSPSAARPGRAPSRRANAMSDFIGGDLAWWAWALLAIGVVAVVSVVGALFLPDWKEPAYTVGLDAEPGSGAFVDAERRVPEQSGLPRRRGDAAAERRRVLPRHARGHPGRAGHGELRGLHLRARRDRAAIHGCVQRESARGSGGAAPGGLVRLVQVQAPAPRASSSMPASRSRPFARSTSGTWSGCTAGPTGGRS